MVQAAVTGLYIDPKMETTAIVLLKEVEGDRTLPIYIEINLAMAIAKELKKTKNEFDRPQAHDLIATVVNSLRSRIVRVLISDLRDRVYYARILLESSAGLLEIDARPSDSIVLALKSKAPIMIDEVVFDKKAKDGSESDGELGQDLRDRLRQIPPEDFGNFSLNS